MKNKIFLIVFSLLVLNLFNTSIVMAEEETDMVISEEYDIDSENDTTSSAIQPKGEYKYKVIANNVNVREKPSTSSTSYGQMNWGDVCYGPNTYVLGDGIKWKYVTCGAPLTDVKGYIALEYPKEVVE